MNAGRQYVTHFNMQRELEASQAAHLDLAKRYDVLAARLAEVEEELLDLKAPDPEADQWRRSEETAREVESRRMEAELRSAREQRDKAEAERDRLAQELEDKAHESAQYHASYEDAADRMFRFKAERDEAIALLRDLLRGIEVEIEEPVTSPLHSAALDADEFLARFPEKEDGKA